jgi:hypoxanthine phosphoribosyltransferase
MIKKRYLGYTDMHDMLNVMYRQMALDEYKPDIVVGLVRGGMIPAVHVSHYYDVPMVAFKYSLRDHPGADPIEKLVEVIRSNKRVLIVDDICDEGHTLHEIHQQLETHLANARDMATAVAEANGYDVDLETYDMARIRVAVLQHNLGATLFSPDYSGEEINKIEKPEWIVYPWEYE